MYACSARLTNQYFMPEKTQKRPIQPKNHSYLPDFCNTEVFLRALLVIELIAIMFTLVRYSSGSFYVQLALISVMMLWTGLCVVATLCWINRQGWLKTTLSTTVLSIGILCW